MELSMHALLQQHAQQRSGRAMSQAEPAGAGHSALLGSGAPSAPASPPKVSSSWHFSGFAAAAAACSRALPLEVQAYLQQQEQERHQQAAAAVAAATAAASQEQQAALGWAPASGTSAQGCDSYTDGGANQAWPAANPGIAAFQSAVYGWGGEPLAVEQQAAAVAAHGTLPQALFSLQLPQRLQLQALLGQQQQLLLQQACVGGAAYCPPGMAQASGLYESGGGRPELGRQPALMLRLMLPRKLLPCTSGPLLTSLAHRPSSCGAA